MFSCSSFLITERQSFSSFVVVPLGTKATVSGSPYLYKTETIKNEDVFPSKQDVNISSSDMAKLI